MKDNYYLHTIRENTKHTKKDVEELVTLLNRGYDVVDNFSYKNERYFVLGHEFEVEVKQAN